MKLGGLGGPERCQKSDFGNLEIFYNLEISRTHTWSVRLVSHLLSF